MLIVLLVAAAPVHLYLSVGGSDGNAGTAAAPFSTFERLQARLRDFPRGAGRPPITVHLKGSFQLDRTVRLGAESSGVKFVGPAVISGGSEIRGWRRSEFNGHDAWAADVPPGFEFRELFIGRDHARGQRPRVPKSGFFSFAGYAPDGKDPKNNAGDERTDGQTAMRFRAGDLSSTWKNLQDIELVAHQFWITSRLPIASMAGDVVRFSKRSVFRLNDDYTSGLAPYAAENVAEAMDEPGEWYLDRPNHTVYVLPRKGDRLRDFVAAAPRLSTLVRVEGAEGTTFEGVTFRDAEWNLPSDSSGDVQAAVSVPGAVQIVDAANVTLSRCRIEHSGTYGVEILGRSTGCQVVQSTLADLGAGGIKIDDGPMRNLISDNLISGTGRVFASACGIFVKLSGDNQIIHNRVEDGYYTGISVGWDWGFRDTAARNNLIAFNDISRIGQDQLSDMGGIYVLGKQPGSRIVNNRVRDVSARGYGGWGIYLDEGSTGWTVENNLVARTKTGGFHIHYGGNNVIRHNVFAFARTEGQLIRSRDDQQGPIRFENNLVVARPGDAPLVVPSWLKRDVVMTGNLYCVPATSMPFGDDGTGRFIQMATDADGLPKGEAAARKLGFAPIDVRSVGPRKGKSPY